MVIVFISNIFLCDAILVQRSILVSNSSISCVLPNVGHRESKEELTLCKACSTGWLWKQAAGESLGLVSIILSG